MSSIASGGSSQQQATANLQMEKKKTKVLRQALKEERETRSQVDKELKAAQAKIEELTQQIAEKEKRYLDIYQEKASLEETLIKESRQKEKLQSQVSQVQVKPTTFGIPNPYSQATNIPQQPVVPQQDNMGNPLPDDRVEQLEMQVSKQAGQLIVAEGKITEYEKQVQTLNEQIQLMEQSYQKFVAEETDNKEKLEKKIQELQYEVSFNKREHKEAMDAALAKEQENIDKLNQEIKEVQAARDKLFDEKFKVEEEVDAKLKRIKDLERDLQLAHDEVNCRKQIIEQMNENMIRHETESSDMANKLTLMKNQIMEFNLGMGMNKKYAAVKIGTIKHMPCSLEFVEPENQQIFLVIDSRSQEVTINIENIDTFRQVDETNRINIVYYIQTEEPTQSTSTALLKKIKAKAGAKQEENEQPETRINLIKKTETFECYETDDIIGAFKACRNKVQGTGALQQFQGHNFQKQTAASTPKARRSSVLKTD